MNGSRRSLLFVVAALAATGSCTSKGADDDCCAAISCEVPEDAVSSTVAEAGEMPVGYSYSWDEYFGPLQELEATTAMVADCGGTSTEAVQWTLTAEPRGDFTILLPADEHLDYITENPARWECTDPIQGSAQLTVTGLGPGEVVSTATVWLDDPTSGVPVHGTGSFSGQAGGSIDFELQAGQALATVHFDDGTTCSLSAAPSG